MKKPISISFKPLEISDITLVYNWTNQPHVKQWWEDSEDWESFKHKFEQKISSPHRLCFIIKLDEHPIGYIQAYQAHAFPEWADEDESTFGMDLFIGDPEYVSKGYGTLIVRQFTDHLFSLPQIKKIITDPDEKNMIAIRAYKKAGFKKRSIKTTGVTTEIVMEMTHKELP